MPVPDKVAAIKTIQATVVCPDPQLLIAVKEYTYNYIAADAGRITRLMCVLREAFRLAIVFDESSTVGADPDIAFIIFRKAVDIIER